MRMMSVCTLVIGGTLVANAAMAAATTVNIADPNATSRVAKVEVGNRLAVQEVSPSTFFHTVTNDMIGSDCYTIAAPPAGKALLVRQVRVDVFQNSTPGDSNNVQIFADGNCNPADFVGDVNPPTVGLFTITFDPGLAVPAGSALSARANENIAAEAFVDGYKVDSSVVPQAGGQSIEVHGKARQ